MSRRISLDRIEGKIAIGEDDEKNKVEIPVSRLPKGAKPPHVLDESDDGVLTINHEETERRRINVANMLDDLFAKGSNPQEEGGN